MHPPLWTPRSTSASPSVTPAPVDDDAAFAALETSHSARVGVFAIDTGTGASVGYRADERFAFDSTYKALACGVVLKTESDAELAAVVHYSATDLVANSPITGQHVATGLSVSALCDAAIRYSDNTAANLLFGVLGSPSGLQAKWRMLGDTTTNSDRTETALNEAAPGDPRDTSTPRVLATDLRGFAVDDTGSFALTAARRAVLNGWLDANTTGATLIRAAVPAGWTVGDKSGSGGHGSRNDIAVLTPPTGAPIVIAVTTTHAASDAATDDALVAAVAGEALKALGR
ncbi:class A beta-lactamase [Frondihabitans cladoniiphilus]|uniref:Beta-lactamase n=1 Tax=Frondihabitans cladoniiphilus TaxID=715785 RepID=A0ABP8WAH2_9MICO